MVGLACRGRKLSRSGRLGLTIFCVFFLAIAKYEASVFSYCLRGIYRTIRISILNLISFHGSSQETLTRAG